MVTGEQLLISSRAGGEIYPGWYVWYSHRAGYPPEADTQPHVQWIVLSMRLWSDEAQAGQNRLTPITQFGANFDVTAVNRENDRAFSLRPAPEKMHVRCTSLRRQKSLLISLCHLRMSVRPSIVDSGDN